jgi:hypothetical protein
VLTRDSPSPSSVALKIEWSFYLFSHIYMRVCMYVHIYIYVYVLPLDGRPASPQTAKPEQADAPPQRAVAGGASHPPTPVKQREYERITTRLWLVCALRCRGY